MDKTKRIAWEAWVALGIAIGGGLIGYGRISAQVEDLKQTQTVTSKDVSTIKEDVAEIKGELRNTVRTRSVSTAASGN